MTPEELVAFRAQFGLSQPNAADLVGVDERTWRRWETAVNPIPPPCEKLVVLYSQIAAVRPILDALAVPA